MRPAATLFGKFIDDETRKQGELIRMAGFTGNRQVMP
jgi:hypothetical protein